MVTDPNFDAPRTLLMGGYVEAIAVMEHNGIPIDIGTLQKLEAYWIPIKERLIQDIDNGYSKVKIPPFRIQDQPKSSIGCGDTFDAYFVVGQLKKYDLQTSTNLATIAAGTKRKKELGEPISPEAIYKELTAS